MAQTAITLKEASETPILLGAVSCDASNGNSVSNLQENVLLYLKNTDGSNSATVTITAQKTSIKVPGIDTLTASNIVVSMAFGSEYIVGPFSKVIYNDANDNLILAITGSGAASVKITPIHMAALAKI